MVFSGKSALYSKFGRIQKFTSVAARKALLKGALELAAKQKRLAPVDYGDLRASIAVTPPGTSTPSYSQPGGSRQAGPFQAIITAGNSKVRYAHLVEFGTAPHANGGLFAGTQHPGTAAQPYFWPAYRLLRRRLRGRIFRDVKKAIRSASVS